MPKKLKVPKTIIPRKPSWLDNYEVVIIVPGIIVTQSGEVDLSNADLPLETIDNIYKQGCPYLKLKKAQK